MNSSNPALKNILAHTVSEERSKVMTLNGTVNKTGILLLCSFMTAVFTWSAGPGEAMPFMLTGLIGGFIVSLATIFKPSWAAFTAPVYALLEGLFLGAFSRIFDEMLPGLPFLAVVITFSILGVMAFLYRTGVVRVNRFFRTCVICATGGIALAYIAVLILGATGTAAVSLSDMGLIGVGISLVISAVASLNLLLDFEMIAEGVSQGAPAYMEWYGAFALMVTLVWIYIEIARLIWLIYSIIED